MNQKMVDEAVASGEVVNRDFFGSGPNGAFLAFADSVETVKRWVAEGYLHKHDGQQTPMHKDVCPCERYI